MRDERKIIGEGGEGDETLRELLEFSIINVDKPCGPTSFWVDEFIKKKLGLRKTSHAGTLDPGVSGCLPILCNRACRLLSWFLKSKKTYVGVMRIHKDINKEKLKQEMKKFEGKIKQKPPVRSRVARKEREREIYRFELLEKNGRDVLFEAEVEAGTYVRKLIHDLGLRIGGAHMSELRRIRSGVFSENDKKFVNLYEFEKAIKENRLRDILIPAEEAVKKIMEKIEVKEESIKRLLTGKPIFLSDIKKEYVEKFEKLKDGQEFCIFAGKRFIEVAKKVKEGKIVARPLFVKN